MILLMYYFCLHFFLKYESLSYSWYEQSANENSIQIGDTNPDIKQNKKVDKDFFFLIYDVFSI